MARFKKWSQNEIGYLKLNYIKLTDTELSNNLDRTIPSIKDKRYLLDLYRPDQIQITYNVKYAEKAIERMKILIWIIERCSNRFQRDKYMPELKRLSGL